MEVAKPDLETYMATMNQSRAMHSIESRAWRALAPALGFGLMLLATGCSGGGSIGTETHSLHMAGAPGDQDTSANSASSDSTNGGTVVASTDSGAKSATGSKDEAGAGKVTTEYKLGTGDQLQVSVFGQPDLSGKFEVDGNGNITLPLIGPEKAEGKTVNEVQQSVTTEFNKSFLVNAKVSVQVLNYRPFYILGEIGKPGSYPYVSGLTIRQAVAIAGGFTRRARESPLRVIRAGKDSADAEDAMPDDPVLPGDTINVDRRIF
jgi:protein involved in polysaccharide export with SLBB domain